MRCAGNTNLFLSNHFDDPRTYDDHRERVRHHHLVVFKQFVIPGGEKQGDEGKEKNKSGANHPITPGGEFH